MQLYDCEWTSKQKKRVSRLHEYLKFTGRSLISTLNGILGLTGCSRAQKSRTVLFPINWTSGAELILVSPSRGFDTITKDN